MAGRYVLVALLAASTFATPLPLADSSNTGYTAASNTTSDSSSEPSSQAEVTDSGAAAKPSVWSLGGPAASAYHSPAVVTHGSDLTPSLFQLFTNGKSQLGTFSAPQLFAWVGAQASGNQGNNWNNQAPWGGKTASNTNQYTSPPDTGVTRYYTFDITEQTIAPDGVERTGFVVNGAFPGPTIEANWGDWFEITVNNKLSTEGTSIHWHGLLQTATPWMDGVPAVQQCPIPPGSSFTYRFRGDLYGSSWYHSHYSAQYANGIFGPMIIHGPDTGHYDVDLGPVLVSDWYHTDYYTLVEQVMAPASEGRLPPMSNSNLINGKMNYPCASATGLVCHPNAGISKFHVTSGKKYRLRLMNAGAEAIQKFSIDGYKLTVIANDFVPITPYEVDVVTLSVGQRSDVVFTASGKPTDSVWMRSTVGNSAFVGGCTLNDGVNPEAVAAIYYQHANTSEIPLTNSTITEAQINTCANDPLSSTVPAYRMAPPANPETVQRINITYQSNGTNDLFYMNNSTFRGDYNNAILLDAKEGKLDFDAEWNVYNFNESKSIRLVVYNYAQTGAHPMHLHGHNMYVLDVGTGEWDGSIVRPSNPQRRDVQLLPVAVSDTEPAYIVIQIDADNPGAWPFHCHIAWHVSAGLYITILERPNDIKNEMQIPTSLMQNTCDIWQSWTNHDIPNEIDSGL
ncbi:hypothetical protein EJ03DRAFT_375281 [Teratosphaeria nubilosa]|uniref:Multicopper oxidase n=1 Tax=Teratosphaeria nubilosa TaxID=161662 RepID=A0A6G1L6E0_9PEZI|nr:hypothetical protein EJ03DRAFT_375281 [Teratosphaeria nubilosa]